MEITADTELPANVCAPGDVGLVEMLSGGGRAGMVGRPKKFQSHILHRRSLVSQLRLRGFSIQKIQKELPNLGSINPTSQKPWSIGQIFKDLRALEQGWREFAHQNVSQHRARVLAEIQEVKRAAWLGGDHAVVLHAIDREMKMLGVAAPERLQAHVVVNTPLENNGIFDRMTIEELRVLDGAVSRIAESLGPEGVEASSASQVSD